MDVKAFKESVALYKEIKEEVLKEVLFRKDLVVNNITISVLARVVTNQGLEVMVFIKMEANINGEVHSTDLEMNIQRHILATKTLDLAIAEELQKAVNHFTNLIIGIQLKTEIIKELKQSGNRNYGMDQNR